MCGDTTFVERATVSQRSGDLKIKTFPVAWLRISRPAWRVSMDGSHRPLNFAPVNTPGEMSCIRRFQVTNHVAEDVAGVDTRVIHGPQNPLNFAPAPGSCSKFEYTDGHHLITSSYFVERTWHMQDSHGQILALAFRKSPFKTFSSGLPSLGSGIKSD